MAYRQLEEAMLSCLKCKREYGVTDSNAQFGLFRNGQMMRCSKCFEQLKHDFWLRLMEQGT